MASMPCQNPSCKSFGRPHPNCKCFAGMAEGGEVINFCDENRQHHENCMHHQDLSLKDSDPLESVAGYLAHQGLHGVLRLHDKPHLEKFLTSIKHGHKHIDSRIKPIFSAEDFPHSKNDYTKEKKEIHEWISKGGSTGDIQNEIYESHTIPESFAKGGEVKSEHSSHNAVETEMPNHNIALHAAKGRMSSYLNALRPQTNVPKLAFDSEPDQREQHKSYNKALHLAAHPLHILGEIHKGTVEPEDIHHFKNLHPELDNVLQKKMTEKIAESQMEDKKPSYKIRQGMSMFMGVPLSGELTPENIQAAQATFNKPAQKAAAPTQTGPQKPSNKKGTSSLTKSSQSFLTGNQALTVRQQKQ